MLGLFGTLNLGTRSLQTQQAGVEVTGQNLANVNNPAYARQRIQIQTSLAIPSEHGPVGTGAEAIGVEQLRNGLIDAQIRSEQSVGGYWLAQQSGLSNLQLRLSEYLDRGAGSVNGSSDPSSPGSLGLSSALTNLFNSFQAVSASPASLPHKQALISSAETLAKRFNEVAAGIGGVRDVLNTAIAGDVNSANALLGDIATLNDQIARAEMPAGGTANDLRDLRQQKLESLAKLVDFDTATASDGSLTVSIGGTEFVSGKHVTDRLATFGRTGEFNGPDEIVVVSAKTQAVLGIQGGSIAGSIGMRDGSLEKLQEDLDTFASALIDEVNALHSSGPSGLDFFTGNSAATIGVNATLRDDPSQFQSSGSGASGDNSIALALAQLGGQKLGALGNLTLSDFFGKVTASVGHALSDATTQVTNFETISNALLRQRDAISGVSIDEEMTNLLTYQKAYQASAKIVSTVDEMLDIIINLKR
ncbi:MAG TPA: flagellar hook-associated protein FlgK [Verrucomicrobiae bacterium]|nr:flagellar hook-associated protein FlgK [Verrucomicrobiae bacterium]